MILTLDKKYQVLDHTITAVFFIYLSLQFARSIIHYTRGDNTRNDRPMASKSRANSSLDYLYEHRCIPLDSGHHYPVFESRKIAQSTGSTTASQNGRDCGRQLFGSGGPERITK